MTWSGPCCRRFDEALCGGLRKLNFSIHHFHLFGPDANNAITGKARGVGWLSAVIRSQEEYVLLSHGYQRIIRHNQSAWSGLPAKLPDCDGGGVLCPDHTLHNGYQRVRLDGRRMVSSGGKRRQDSRNSTNHNLL